MSEGRRLLPARSLALLGLLLLFALPFKLGYHRSFAELDPLAVAPYGDSVTYLEEAATQFGGEEAPRAFYKPPLYALLLHLAGADDPQGAAAVRWIQAALGCMALVMVFLLARSRGGDLAGAIAFLAMAAYAPATFHETKLLDTVLSLFLTLLACVALDPLLRGEKGRSAALGAGLLIGVAALCRSANLLLAILGAALLLRRRRVGPAAALLLGALVPVLPVTLWNGTASGDFIPVNYSEGHTFLVGNNPNCRGIYNLPEGYPDGVLGERQVEFARAKQALGRDPTPGEQRDDSYAQGFAFLREHPRAVPGLLLDKLRFAVSSYSVNDNYSLRRERERYGLLTWFRLPFSLLVLLGLGSFWLRSRSAWGAVGLPVVVTFLLLLMFYVTERYRLPMAPFLAVAAGVGLADLLVGERRKAVPQAAWSRAAATLICCGGFLLAVPLPVPSWDLADSEQLFALTLDVHAARTLLEQDDLERAAAIFAVAVRDYPGVSSLESEFLALIDGRTKQELASIATAAREAAPGAPRVEALLRLASGR